MHSTVIYWVMYLFLYLFLILPVLVFHSNRLLQMNYTWNKPRKLVAVRNPSKNCWFKNVYGENVLCFGAFLFRTLMKTHFTDSKPGVFACRWLDELGQTGCGLQSSRAPRKLNSALWWTNTLKTHNSSTSHRDSFRFQ